MTALTRSAVPLIVAFASKSLKANKAAKCCCNILYTGKEKEPLSTFVPCFSTSPKKL